MNYITAVQFIQQKAKRDNDVKEHCYTSTLTLDGQEHKETGTTQAEADHSLAARLFYNQESRKLLEKMYEEFETGEDQTEKPKE